MRSMSFSEYPRRLLNRLEAELFRRYALPPAREGIISKRYIARYLPENPVIVDCGAHVGHDSVEMAALWPASTVHAFEAVPEIFQQLAERVASYRNIKCYEVAVSDRSGVQQMYVSGGSSDGSSSLLAPELHLQDHPTVTFDQTVTVSTVTFAEWSREHQITQVDLFWLDMQGYEYQAMMASLELVRRARAIHVEVSMRSTYRDVVLYPELRKWLEGEGFKVAIEAIPAGWDMGNVLFIRRELPA